MPHTEQEFHATPPVLTEWVSPKPSKPDPPLLPELLAEYLPSPELTGRDEFPGYDESPPLSEALPIPLQRQIRPYQRSGELAETGRFNDVPDMDRDHAPIPQPCEPSQVSPSWFAVAAQEPVPEPQYPTCWRGAVTMEDLLTDRQVRKVAFAKARSLGYTDQDAEDCFQLGATNLWKALNEQPALLSDKGAAWVGVWIAFSGSRRALWKHNARNVSLDDPKDALHTADERLELYPRNRTERWATFATRTDERLDFELLINTLARQYGDDSTKLLALYALTTSVKMKEVAALAGIDKKRFAQLVGNEVKDDIRRLLGVNDKAEASTQDWTDRLKQGGNLDFIARVAQRVLDNQRLLLALYIVTTSATRKEVTDAFKIGRTAFRQDVIQIKTLLAAEFQKAKQQLRRSA